MFDIDLIFQSCQWHNPCPPPGCALLPTQSTFGLALGLTVIMLAMSGIGYLLIFGLPGDKQRHQPAKPGRRPKVPTMDNFDYDRMLIDRRDEHDRHAIAAAAKAFHICGKHRLRDDERQLTIWALTEHNARIKAEMQGLVISSCRELETL